MIIKTATSGLDLDVGDFLDRLVESKFPEFSSKWAKAFRNTNNFSTAEISGQLCEDVGFKKVMKDAYKVLVDEANKHSGWTDQLCSVMTRDGMKWVKKEFKGKYM